MTGCDTSVTFTNESKQHSKRVSFESDKQNVSGGKINEGHAANCTTVITSVIFVFSLIFFFPQYNTTGVTLSLLRMSLLFRNFLLNMVIALVLVVI